MEEVVVLSRNPGDAGCCVVFHALITPQLIRGGRKRNSQGLAIAYSMWQSAGKHLRHLRHGTLLSGYDILAPSVPHKDNGNLVRSPAAHGLGKGCCSVTVSCLVNQVRPSCGVCLTRPGLWTGWWRLITSPWSTLATWRHSNIAIVAAIHGLPLSLKMYTDLVKKDDRVSCLDPECSFTSRRNGILLA